MKQKQKQRLNSQGNRNAILMLNELISKKNSLPIKIGKLSKEISISHNRIFKILQSSIRKPSINSEVSIFELKILIKKFKEKFDTKKNPVSHEKKPTKKAKKRKFIKIILSPIESNRRRH